MDVTVFKDISSTNTPFHRDVSVVFNRIKKGYSKELIEGIRKEKDSTKRNELKKKLPSICFSGKFTKRNDSAILEHSGLICLDFDKFDDDKMMKDFDKNIRKDKYTFASFVSPSGNGYKVIVKIPNNSDYHKMYFEALKEHYDSKYFDVTSKNLSRVCYESYDPNLYENKDSELWTEKNEYQQFEVKDRKPVIRLESSNEKINALVIWFDKKYSMTEGGRNNNLFILAAAFNQYGVPKMDASNYLRGYNQKGFEQSEIDGLTDSAYSNSTEFNTKYFENNKVKDFVSKQIRIGVNKEEIKKHLVNSAGLNDDAALEAITKIEEDTSVNQFWSFNKNGSVSVVGVKFKFWLEQNGFFRFYPEGSDSSVFVRIQNNLVSDTSEQKIKDFVLKFLIKKEDMKVYQHFTERTKYCKEDYLGLLDNISVSFNNDTKDKSYLYFRNKAVCITKDGFEEIDYMHLDGYVWEKHVINRDFEANKGVVSDYQKFIHNVSGQDSRKEASMRSTIGYMIHSWKTSANNVAVILNDEMISENPNGGTGKGIFINALVELKKVVVIDGKNFDSSKSFPYQTVSADTNVLVFDDVRKNFNFENLFSLITEGITLEKKNKDAIKLPIDKSPKIMISTNYAIKGDGNSFERRKWDLEFAQHYQVGKTPEDEFGRMLFGDEWSDKDWTAFYAYMIDCVKLYLAKGLVKTDFNNLAIRRFIAKTSYEFYEWATDGNLPLNVRLYRGEKYTEYLDDNKSDGKFLTQRKFSRWVEDYGKFMGGTIETGRSASSRWIWIDTPDSDKTAPEDDDGVYKDPF